MRLPEIQTTPFQKSVGIRGPLRGYRDKGAPTIIIIIIISSKIPSKIPIGNRKNPGKNFVKFGIDRQEIAVFPIGNQIEKIFHFRMLTKIINVIFII